MGTAHEHTDQHGHGHAHGHGHGHAHGHGRRPGSWAGRAWTQLRHVVTPHSHDRADRFDSALETSKRGMRTLVWSFLALFVTAIAQLVIVLFTGSVALLGDTIHNFADALTALPVGIAFALGRRAASRRFTYGLGRAEDLAGVVVVVIIALSAALAGYEAVKRLIDPQPVTGLWVVAAAGVIGFLGNELVARWRITVGRQIGSAALVADGLHARTDGFTSLAVVLGAAGVGLGFPLADPIIGLVITAAILLVLRDAAKEVFRRLMDAVDPATVGLVERTAATVDGVQRAGQVRIRWIGHALRAELAVGVDATLTVAEAHRLAHEVEHRLIHEVPRLTAAVVHTEPVAGAEAAHQLLAHH
ncbi:cation diffusion facilitator transporter [Amycolatopsis deserti]|uniref:Cation diffusion facilitator transporter n=1 Tax=Amycolatopsis deserti TaxID=185696 RepID=A0ABQ3IDA7_9PSEU|nr:cation diffusion facilitator family transporter [Amycolatopsis deserti]GHE79162.1 cation diffusion facilitator transporter [Amycolatopsis deserti]